MNMFELFKHMNGSFFSKSKYINGVGCQILAHKSIPKLQVDTPPRTLFIIFVCLFLRLLKLKCISWFYFISAIVFQYRSPAAVKLENEINHQQHKHRTVINHNKKLTWNGQL